MQLRSIVVVLVYHQQDLSIVSTGINRELEPIGLSFTYYLASCKTSSVSETLVLKTGRFIAGRNTYIGVTRLPSDPNCTNCRRLISYRGSRLHHRRARPYNCQTPPHTFIPTSPHLTVTTLFPNQIILPLLSLWNVGTRLRYRRKIQVPELLL